MLRNSVWVKKTVTCGLLTLIWAMWAMAVFAGWTPLEAISSAGEAQRPTTRQIVLRLGWVRTAWMQAEVQVSAELELQARSLRISRLVCQASQIKVRRDQGWIKLNPLTITAQGRMQDLSLSLTRIGLSYGDQTIGHGQARVSARGGQGEFTIHLPAVRTHLTQIFPGLSRLRFPDSESPELDLDLAWQPADQVQMDLSCSSRVQVTGAGKGTHLILPPLSASIKARMRDWKLRGRIQGTGRGRWQQMAFVDPHLSLQAQLGRDPLTVEGLRAGCSSLFRAGRQAAGQSLSLRAKRVVYADQEIRIPEAVVSLENAGQIQVQGAWTPGREPVVQARGSGLRVEGLRSWVRAWQGPVVPGWDLGGRMGLQASMNREGRESGIEVSLEMQDGQAASPDGQMMAAGVKAGLECRLQLGSRPAVSFDLTTGQGEVLYTTWYVNMSQHPLTVQGRATLTPGRRLDISEVSAQWGSIASARGRVEYSLGSSPSTTWRAKLDSSQVNLPQLQSAVQGLLPSQGQVQGRLACRGRVLGTTRGTELYGWLDLHQLGIRLPAQGVSVQGLKLELPVLAKMPGSKMAAAVCPQSSAWGWLHPGQIQVAGHTLQLTPLRLRLCGRSLQVKNGTQLRMPGIQAKMSDMGLRLTGTGSWQAEADLNLEEVEPKRLVPGWPDAEAFLGGKLHLVASPARVQANGSLQGRVFGGEVRVQNLECQRPLEASRVLGADLSIQRLDLEALSQTLGIGRITGGLNLDLNNFGFAYGQPVSFHLRAVSPPEPNQERTISLQAVNTLSILGTGRGISGLGMRLYAGFFEQFPYERIGVSCVLANDVFALNGLIHAQGVEYIVKRDWLGINVINSNPNNMIAFSDMLDRLERVFQERDTAVQSPSSR